MKINLEDWNQKECRVTLRNGKKFDVTVRNGHEFYKYPYYWVGIIEGTDLRYFKSGKYYENKPKDDHLWDIIHIEELTMKTNTQQILEEISKTQEQLNKLQEELKKAEVQEKFFTSIQNDEQLKAALSFLKTREMNKLKFSFTWDATPEGYDYWYDINSGTSNLYETDILKIKDWVINYLIQKQV